MLKSDARLNVVRAFDVRQVGPKARVRQCPVLIEGRRGTARNEAGSIRENVCARVIVKYVPPHERSQREKRRRAD